MTEPSRPALLAIWRTGSSRARGNEFLAKGLVAFKLKLVKHLDAAQVSNSAAGNNAFFNGSAGCIQGIFDTGLSSLSSLFQWQHRH